MTKTYIQRENENQKKMQNDIQNIYSESEIIEQVKATMSMEHMDLTEEDIFLLKEYRKNKIKKESIRKNLISKYKKDSMKE